MPTAFQITLGALMCLLIVVQFVKELHRVYKVTKKFKLNHYIKCLVKEGMIYFIMYVILSHPYYWADDS